MDVEFSDLEKVILKYPGLIITKFENKHTSLQGPVKIKGIWFNIKISFLDSTNIKEICVEVQQGLSFETYKSEKLNVPSEWSIEKLIENLHTIVENTDATSNHHRADRNDGLDINVYKEIVNLYNPTEYEILLNDTCSIVRFTKFTQNEQHFLEVALPSLELLKHSLPSCINWQELLGKSTSLMTLLKQYKRFLSDLQPFYENFTDIDELCHVVQPTLPNLNANWRLFVLKEKVFIKVQFKDPFSPLSSMMVNFIGPTSEVAHLRRIYNEGINDWDNELDVHKNLLRIFDLCFFPMTPDEHSAKYQQYCNICYCYKFETGEIPIVSCDNNRCSLIFHSACLKEWFNTLADGKTFLNVDFGACPFCKTKLSTSFQEIFE